MSFREKSAWITLISILLVFLFYFTHVGPRLFDPDPGEWQLMVIGVAIAAFVVIEVIAQHRAIPALSERGAHTEG
jgi:hypothetical protein